jgi:prepilin-type processing-associated H-X9-DG protein
MSKKLIYLIPFVLVLCLVKTSKANNIDPNTSEGFNLYLDDIAPNIINSSWFDKGILDYHSQDNPASGNYCIHWTGVGQYSAISFRFVPVKDLSMLVNEGYVIDFWVRCNNPDTRIDIRFVDTKTNERDHPWRMLYTVDRNVAVWDGRWKHLQILLNDFSEHGSMDNDRWYNPVGDFDWSATEYFEIVAEHKDLVGTHFYVDDIRVVNPKLPDRIPLVGRSANTTVAEKPIRYYKEGDVGAFSAIVEIPSGINVKKTIFTVQASNEKAYLLYVESAEAVESIAESLVRAMLPSQRLNQSKNNLWAIGRACLIYSGEHNRKFPPNLQELVEKKYLSPKDLESPFKPSGFDGPSYIYIAGQRGTDNRNILAYENPAFFSDSINVLFVDNHVEVMTPEKFLASLETTNLQTSPQDNA